MGLAYNSATTIFMKNFPSLVSSLSACVLLAFASGAMAQTAAPVAAVGVSAKDLAAQLSALHQDGSSFIKLKMDVEQPPGTKTAALQLQIKQRRTRAGTEVVYQVLWPKERAGEAVLLRQAGNQAPSGAMFMPPNTAKALTAAQMSGGLFGSGLSYADILENFFAWENQAIVGTEVVDRVPCQILESKPGKAQRSSYGFVRTWVDARRLVPMRVEKYNASSQLARRIVTTRVVSDDGRHLPANLAISAGNSVTELDGSRLKRGVVFADREFTPEGLAEMTAPRSAP